jgi:hypothetical protein
MTPQPGQRWKFQFNNQVAEIIDDDTYKKYCFHMLILSTRQIDISDKIRFNSPNWLKDNPNQGYDYLKNQDKPSEI